MTKKATKNTKTFNKYINLNSRKGKIILSLFAFIVIGGGIMVYKSFAASMNTTFTVANGGLVTARKEANIPSTGSTIVVENGAKGPVSVVKLTPVAPILTADPLNTTNIPALQEFTVCAVLKGNVKPLQMSIVMRTSAGSSFKQLFSYDTNLGDSHQFCTFPTSGYKMTPTSTSFNVRGPITVSLEYVNADVTVSSVTVNYVDPAPAPSK